MSLRRWVRSPHWMLIFASLVYSRRKRSSPTLTAGPHNAGGWGRGDLDSDRSVFCPGLIRSEFASRLPCVRHSGGIIMSL